MDWLQKDIRYGPVKLDYILKLYKIFDEVIKLIENTMENKSGIDSMRKKLSRGENSERDLLKRCTITIIICDHDDATQSNI